MRVITFDKGSKRRMRRVQWRRTEIASMILLALFTLTIAGFVLIWELAHDSSNRTLPISRTVVKIYQSDCGLFGNYLFDNTTRLS